MARIKLSLPEVFPFACELTIRVTDLNYGAHLGNDRLLGLIHEARYQFFLHYGYTELAAEGTSFIMGDCAIVYIMEGFHGQRLRCEVGVGDYANSSFDVLYRFTLAETGELFAEAKTGLVCFNYETRRVQRVPAALRARLGDVYAIAATPNSEMP
jgi:acyl-CoA thioester hydrolase